MADGTPLVNQVCLFFLGHRQEGQSQMAQPRSDLRVKPTGSIRLTDELPGPTEEGAELIRVGHKIDDERHRGQHEDCISHGFLPCTDMLILHASFRNQRPAKVNTTGRKIRRPAGRAGWQR